MSPAEDAASQRRNRPGLFASNRKLRHLNGISVRNLVVTPSDDKHRGKTKTIDDEDIPNTLRSPSKAFSRVDNCTIHHSRSFTDLELPRKNGESSDNRTPERRRRGKNALPWSDPDPQARQVKLEDITKSRMADTWFSIHCDGIEAPVYVSEVVNGATNPDFRSFDLNVCGPLVARLDCMNLKLWAKTASMGEFVLLIELQLCLSSLQFLGKSLDNFHQPLPTNSILFHFTDGVYINFTEIPPDWTPLTADDLKSTAARSGAQPTSSYDALMHLANLDECVQDALATRERLEVQISSILEKNRKSLELTSHASQAQDKSALAKHAVLSEKRQLRAATKRKEELLASLKARRESMEHGRQVQEKTRSHLPDAQSNLASSAQLLDQNSQESRGQIRRISEDLLGIYPIEPIPDRPLAFTIAGLGLPNSNFTDIDRDSVAAALGYTAHLVHLLSFYLSMPLPYPITPRLSNSLIQDPVSLLLPQRTYPLYPVNVHYRFEYGVFLLNKDIEFLLNKQGLRIFDIRHTLPNLKYLLYVLTARTSEIPARKAGGIRGLLPGWLSPSMSRRGSEDSVGYGDFAFPRRALGIDAKVNGQATVDKGKRPATSASFGVTTFARRPFSSHVA